MENTNLIKTLTGKQNYAIWSIRVTATLQKSALWDKDAAAPLSNSLAAATIISLISDDLLEQVSHTDLSAPTMWGPFSKKLS